MFSLPAAYTPTCSSTHLPRYNELANVLKAGGLSTRGGDNGREVMECAKRVREP